MSSGAADSPELFSGESRRLETLLTDFESAWFRGERPEISDYLQGDADQQLSLLLELVHIELEFRAKLGEALRVEQYLGRYPLLAKSVERLVELVVFEFQLRQRTEPVALSEYIERFPEIADALALRCRDEIEEVPPATVNRIGQSGDGTTSATCGSLSLAVISGPHRGLRFDIDQHTTIVIGRSDDAQVQLIDDAHFSRFHARLEVVPPECRLTDLDSTNGTYVNGQRAETELLSDGDVVSGGTTRILVTVKQGTDERVAERSLGIERAGAATCESGLEAVLPDGSGMKPVVPGYESQEQIGAGELGTVYRAVHLGSGATVSIKIMHPSQTAEREGVLRFLRRMNRLAQLQQSAIVAVREVGIAGDQPYIVTDYVDALPYADVLRSEREPARDRLACRIVGQVLQALDYAHGESVVHGSLKPANVLLTATGRSLTVRICDFGIASCWMDANLSSVSAGVARPLELAFIPPELVRDCRRATCEGDLYSAGMLLYYLLSGNVPFDYSSEHRLYNQVLNGERVSLGSRRPSISAELLAVVERSLKNDPANRFGTAAAMRDNLKQCPETGP